MKIFYAYKDPALSHEMLFYILDKFYGVKADEKLLKFSENGKPFIENAELYFNITHTDGLIMIAVSRLPIGIDAEWIFRKADFERIEEKYFSVDEKQQIKTSAHFYILWTKKESAIKFAGLTVVGALKDTSFKGENPVGKPEYDGAVTRSYAFDDYVYSVTTKEENQKHDLVYIM